MIVDSHCHLDQLDLTPYDGDLSQVLAQAKELGVEYFLNVCIDLNNFPAVLEIAKQYENISASLGIHPNEVLEDEPTIETLMALADQPDVVAIGETGLDYFRTEEAASWQQERFRRHIQIARKLQKPLIIHTRDAGADTIRILREEKADEIGGVLHCFTDTYEIAKQGIDLNFYVSFSGIVTFKSAVDLQQTAQKLPLDRMLIETDSPYLAPMPYRGKQNYPGYVRYVAEKVAALREVDVDEIAAVTTANFYKLFNIKRREL